MTRPAKLMAFPEKRKRTKEHYGEKRTRQASQAVALPFPHAELPEALPSLPGSPAGAVAAGEKLDVPFRMFETQSSSSSSDLPAIAVSALQPTAASRTRYQRRHPKMEDVQEPFPQSLPFPPPCGDAFLAALVAERSPQKPRMTSSSPGSDVPFVSPPRKGAGKQTNPPPPPPFLLAVQQGKTQTATATGLSKVMMMDAKPVDPCQNTNVSASSNITSAATAPAAVATEPLPSPSRSRAAAAAAAASRHEELPRTAVRRRQRASITASRRTPAPGREMQRAATPLGAVMQHWERLWREPSELCQYWLGRPLFRRRRTEADDRRPA